ncbi:LysR family transcriptional regulator [Bacillus solimangrovi]|uniref:LysR family transcriptional regulator n=1 Tax=Bacillus solimangrovi TaxID=1305675 RepID=A0A1E5LJI5_9BACI|nr:LysR family transcriptional regulator [Bacillus solimangrovi]OEH94259.1 LysR family transcriptional regulator [Bacillus solimangrovi]
MVSSEFRILVILSEEMNMRKAAERLYVSQPALSQRLQSIEKSWGTKIFLRSQRGLTVTPEGEQIIQFAKEIVGREEQVKEQITSLHSEVHGTLKLAVASIVGQYWLPAVLKDFVKLYPHVKISLVTGWSSEMLRHMYEDHVHLGIIRGRPEWKGKKVHLLSDKLYLVDTEIQNLEQVKETSKPYILFRSDSTYYQEIQDWWHRQIQTTPKRTIVVDQIETCKQMVLNGIGYAILPEVTLTEHDDQVYRIPIYGEDEQQMQRDTWLLGYDAVFELKQVKAFIEFIQRAISANE